MPIDADIDKTTNTGRVEKNNDRFSNKTYTSVVAFNLTVILPLNRIIGLWRNLTCL